MGLSSAERQSLEDKLQAECPAVARRCYRCGELGHLRAQCGVPMSKANKATQTSAKTGVTERENSKRSMQTPPQEAKVSKSKKAAQAAALAKTQTTSRPRPACVAQVSPKVKMSRMQAAPRSPYWERTPSCWPPLLPLPGPPSWWMWQ